MIIQTKEYTSNWDKSGYKTETIPNISEVKVGLDIEQLKGLENKLTIEMGTIKMEKVFDILKESKIDIRLENTISSLFPE